MPHYEALALKQYALCKTLGFLCQRLGRNIINIVNIKKKMEKYCKYYKYFGRNIMNKLTDSNFCPRVISYEGVFLRLYSAFGRMRKAKLNNIQ